MGLSKKLDKEDYLQGMKNLALDEEKFKKAIALGDDIQVRLDKLNEAFDRKLAKLRKDVDINLLMRQLKTKAEDENVQAGFNTVDSKI